MSFSIFKPRKVQMYAGEAPIEEYDLDVSAFASFVGNPGDVGKINSLEAKVKQLEASLKAHHQQVINIGEGKETF